MYIYVNILFYELESGDMEFEYLKISVTFFALWHSPVVSVCCKCEKVISFSRTETSDLFLSAYLRENKNYHFMVCAFDNCATGSRSLSILCNTSSPIWNLCRFDVINAIFYLMITPYCLVFITANNELGFWVDSSSFTVTLCVTHS